jgi:hypothetical protein
MYEQQDKIKWQVKSKEGEIDKRYTIIIILRFKFFLYHHGNMVNWAHSSSFIFVLTKKKRKYLHQYAKLCRRMSSMAVTAATAAFLLDNTFLLPSIFTQLLDPDPDPELALPPTYSASASPPSLSESLNRACGLDFFRFIAWDGEEEAIAAVALVILVDDDEVIEPVVRVGGPGEYIAAADPGRVGKALGWCDLRLPRGAQRAHQRTERAPTVKVVALEELQGTNEPLYPHPLRSPYP